MLAALLLDKIGRNDDLSLVTFLLGELSYIIDYPHIFIISIELFGGHLVSLFDHLLLGKILVHDCNTLF